VTTDFPGFPPEGLQLLADLADHNDRDWFQPRKAAYEATVKAPMVALVEALNDALAAFAPAYRADPKKITRVNRDIRFSADKSPYRTDISVVFPRQGGDKHEVAGFYVGASPAGVDVLGGAYMPGPEQLARLRSRLAADHEAFRAILADDELRRVMGELQGEQLKRVPKDYPADHPAGDLLRHKQLYLATRLPSSVATSPRLLPELTSRMERMTPFVTYLDEALAAG
jgi:uncharacterized protein (TIGR02453 family)